MTDDIFKQLRQNEARNLRQVLKIIAKEGAGMPPGMFDEGVTQKDNYLGALLEEDVDDNE